jgi:hypothetical protein
MRSRQFWATRSRQFLVTAMEGKAYRCRACHAELVSASAVCCSSILSLPSLITIWVSLKTLTPVLAAPFAAFLHQKIYPSLLLGRPSFSSLNCRKIHSNYEHYRFLETPIFTLMLFFLLLYLQIYLFFRLFYKTSIFGDHF